jgi:hypothetical protein
MDMTKSKFRSWCHELWIRNCDERRDHDMQCLAEQHYVQQYRWWLKREFQYQMKRRRSEDSNQ